MESRDILIEYARRALGAVLAVVMFVAVSGWPTVAQELPAETGELETERLESLLDLLEDDTRRAAFVADLEALLALRSEVEGDTEGGIGQVVTRELSEAVDSLSAQTIGTVDTVLNVGELFEQIRILIADPAVRSRWSEIFLKLVLVLVPATAAFLGAQQLIRRPREQMGSRRSKEFLSRLSTLLLRMVLDVLPMLAFAAVAYAILPLTDPRPFTRIVAISAINVTLMIQGTLVLSRAILVPRTPHLRLFALRDETAAYVYVWIRRLAYVGGYSFVVAAALRLLGFSQVGEAVSQIGGLTFALMIIVVVLQNRVPVRRILRGQTPAAHPSLSVLRRQFAEVWHVLAVLYVIGAFVVWSVRIPGSSTFLLRGTVVTLLAIIVARILIAAVDQAVTRFFAVGEQLRERHPQLEQRANRYVPILRRVAGVIIYALAAAMILEAWQIRVSAWLATEFGQRVASGVVTVAIVVAIALAIWELVAAAIERYLETSDEDGNVVERTARERTLLPLLRKALLVVLIVVVALIVLSEIGINIAPLLAAAGVVGIAIGFGSQKLVQDIINGLFMLFEDTIAVGDVVDVAGHAGLVESISVRTLTLRDLEGNVHTIPFSEVATIRNMTKDFSFALLEVGIAYRENVAEVIEVLKQIGAELEADPSLGPLILEPIEILGLDQFGDSAIVIKARMKTKPIKQWAVKRAFNLRMKERFDTLGIEIPYPHMTLYFGEDKSGHAPPAHVALAEKGRKERDAGPARPMAETPLELKDAPTPADE